MLPLFADVRRKAVGSSAPYFLGVSGSPGAGKTTLGLIVRELARLEDFTVLSLSIDDFYLSFEARQRLREACPKFAFRGPPGTHDHERLSALVEQVLQRARRSEETLRVPVFEKSLHAGEGDQVEPRVCDRVPDLLILEGWFVAYRPLPEQELVALLRERVPSGPELDPEFASVVNAELAKYQSVFDRFDALLGIAPEQYAYTKRWRLEAEEKMRKARGRSNGMTDDQISSFIDYFWRSLHPLVFAEQIAERADVHITLNEKREIVQMRRKNTAQLHYQW